jgi:hypothetical protein
MTCVLLFEDTPDSKSFSTISLLRAASFKVHVLYGFSDYEGALEQCAPSAHPFGSSRRRTWVFRAA